MILNDIFCIHFTNKKSSNFIASYILTKYDNKGKFTYKYHTTDFLYLTIF